MIQIVPLNRVIAALLIFLACLSLCAALPAAAQVDPELVFSTYFGGSDSDTGIDVAVDPTGNIYVVGSTGSADFPASNPLGVSTPNIYVTKFDPMGQTTLYSTWLGSGEAYSIAVDAQGYAYVVGRAYDIPTVNAIQDTRNGVEDAFIVKLNPSGSALVYATYLGGSGSDFAMSVALDSSNNAYIVGVTDSTDFPTQNAYQDTFGGGQWDVFVARLNAAGSALVYSTYYGGSIWDISMGIAVDNGGNAYITGDTGSNDFPTVNPYQSNHANWCSPPSPGVPCTDAYVAKFSPAGVPIYSTYLGGDGNFDRGNAITVDSQGSAYITGRTYSTDFPTTSNAYQTEQTSGAAFVTKFSPNGSSLIYSTYLGGTTDGSEGFGIVVDSEGSAYVSGKTWATDFPTVNPIQATKTGAEHSIDVFLAKLNPDSQGQTLLFSTYFGGSGSEDAGEFGSRIALDQQGSVYLFGSTNSDDFPTVNAFQDIPGGGSVIMKPDAFLAKIAFPPASPPTAAAQPYYFTIDTPTLTWSPVTWATGYRVEVSQDATFTAEPDFVDEDIDAAARSITTDPLDDGLYYWRVQARRANGTWGAPSSTQSFTIDADE